MFHWILELFDVPHNNVVQNGMLPELVDHFCTVVDPHHAGDLGQSPMQRFLRRSDAFVGGRSVNPTHPRCMARFPFARSRISSVLSRYLIEDALSRYVSTGLIGPEPGSS